MKKYRLGDKNKNYQGLEMEIVEYNESRNIKVKFKNGDIVETTYSKFITGSIKNKFHPSIIGIGVIGLERITDDKGDDLPSYKTWTSLIKRCYSYESITKHPTYDGCTVCEEWKYYLNFKKWYNENYYNVDNERISLDKDILIKNNKIYSPKTCIFVPIKINSLFTKANKSRGEFPIGVSLKKQSGKFQSRCNYLKDGNKFLKHIGYFKTPEEAFNAYKIFKEKYIKQVADEYKHKIPQKLYDAMYKYEVEITD